MKPREPKETRTPPYDAVRAQHRPEKDGKCQWCGEATEDRTPSTNKLRRWHNACEMEFLQIMRPAIMRGAVFKRDHGICTYCGEDWSERFKFMRESTVLIHESGGSWYTVAQGDVYSWKHSDTHHPFTMVRKVSLWEVEHTTPLWKVAHLPPVERIEFFKLAAVKTACSPCHKIKSAKEAAEKAHHDRLEKKRREKAEVKSDQLQPPPAKKQGRKLQSRGFSREHRPMRRR